MYTVQAQDELVTFIHAQDAHDTADAHGTYDAYGN